MDRVAALRGVLSQGTPAACTRCGAPLRPDPLAAAAVRLAVATTRARGSLPRTPPGTRSPVAAELRDVALGLLALAEELCHAGHACAGKVQASRAESAP